MTIDRQHGRLHITCDVCGEQEEDANANDMPYAFDAFWQAKKEEGWTAMRSGDGWENACPTCSGAK